MLNSAYLTPEQKSALRQPYDVKIAVFDSKCVGCGFAVLRIKEFKDGVVSTTYEFANYQDFLDFLNQFSFVKNIVVERGCKFATEQIAANNNRENYWTVHEITENTCSLWSNAIPQEESKIIGDDFYQFYFSGAIVVDKVFGKPFEGETIEYTEQLEPPVIDGIHKASFLETVPDIMKRKK